MGFSIHAQNCQIEIRQDNDLIDLDVEQAELLFHMLAIAINGAKSNVKFTASLGESHD
jgi:hypothetical protein